MQGGEAGLGEMDPRRQHGEWALLAVALVPGHGRDLDRHRTQPPRRLEREDDAGAAAGRRREGEAAAAEGEFAGAESAVAKGEVAAVGATSALPPGTPPNVVCNGTAPRLGGTSRS